MATYNPWNPVMLFVKQGSTEVTKLRSLRWADHAGFTMLPKFNDQYFFKKKVKGRFDRDREVHRGEEEAKRRRRQRSAFCSHSQRMEVRRGKERILFHSLLEKAGPC